MGVLLPCPFSTWDSPEPKSRDPWPGGDTECVTPGAPVCVLGREWPQAAGGWAGRGEKREHNVGGQVYPAGGSTPWREVEAARKRGAKGYRAHPHPFTLHSPPMAPVVLMAENRAQKPDGTTSSQWVGDEERVGQPWGPPSSAPEDTRRGIYDPWVPGSSRGPPFLWLISQLSEVIPPPDLAASADLGAREHARTINYLASASQPPLC